MKPNTRRNMGILVILFAPFLIWLFVICFIISLKWAKISFIITLVLQIIWMYAVFAGIKKGNQNPGRWDVRKILFILQRIIAIFLPAIFFVVFKLLGFVDFSATYITVFAITQLIMIFYQIFKGRDMIKRDDPYFLLQEKDDLESLFQKEVK